MEDGKEDSASQQDLPIDNGEECKEPSASPVNTSASVSASKVDSLKGGMKSKFFYIGYIIYSTD